MTFINNILAVTDDTDWTKILFGAVFFVIWAASAAMSALAKKREQDRRNRVRDQIATGRPAPSVPERSGVQRQPRPIVRQPVPIRRMPIPPKLPVRSTPPRIRQPQSRPPALPGTAPSPARATPFPAESAATTAPLAATDISSTPAAQRIVRRSNAASASAVKAWLKPATLRQQFILTELFQPPLGLRDQHLQ